MRLSGREQVSHKTLSALIAELELYGYVEVERKGRGRGRGVDFYIYPTDSGPSCQAKTQTTRWHLEPTCYFSCSPLSIHLVSSSFSLPSVRYADWNRD